MRWLISVLAFAAVWIVWSTVPRDAAAMPIEPGPVFALGDHPDGGVAPPLYGLRLDGLDGDGDHIFTFSFVEGGASMSIQLRSDGSALEIRGEVFGGRVRSGAYVSPQLWQVEFTYTDLEHRDGALWAHEGQGSITPTVSMGAFAAGEPIALYDHAGEHPFSFALDTGHRGFEGVSGFGWINHGDPNSHVKHSDWLFAVTAVPVPEPGSFALVCLGAAGLVWLGRRGE